MMMTLIIVIVIIIIRSLFLFYPLGNEIMFVSSTYVGVVLAPNTTKIAFPRDEWEKAVHCTCTYIHISISYTLYLISYILYPLSTYPACLVFGHAKERNGTLALGSSGWKIKERSTDDVFILILYKLHIRVAF